MEYDKMNDYTESVFTVFQKVNKKASLQNDKKMKLVSLMILNYVVKMAKDYNVDLKQVVESESINLIPIFEYISHQNIELYDFSKIQIEDVDTTKTSDLERFILTHIYYITQK